MTLEQRPGGAPRPNPGGRPIVVMKFGGTSVAEPAGRDAVVLRVNAALERGAAPVLVVSAMGRAGAPYATDTLLGLLDGLPSDARERDLIASCGEVISAVLLSHSLRAAGIEAHAYTGADAGIVTDDSHEEAVITEVWPQAVLDAVARGEGPGRLRVPGRLGERRAHHARPGRLRHDGVHARRGARCRSG